jgi:hypothetical protein
MRHKVSCVVCGRRGVVEINDKTRKILDKKWLYYGKVNINSIKTSKYLYKVISFKPELITEKHANIHYDPNVKPKLIEYWECRKCPKG